MMHPNAELITTFYQALQRRDAGGMIACYGPAVVFHDPVFQVEGSRAGAMWRMLCERGKDLRIEFRDVEAGDVNGSAVWEAWYTFSATGYPVHNRIRATFHFQDRRIIRHDDRFDLHRWAGQALGWKGRLLGWAPPVQAAIRKNAARSLDAFLAKAGSAHP
ncbi:MAG: nuclear transport factor 2 family protein [Gemmatimonadales bacterium]